MPNLVKPHSGIASDAGYVYHATSEEHLPDIAAQGLKTFKPWHGTEQDSWPDGSIESRNYFVSNAGHAASFGSGALLRVPKNVHSFKKESGTGDIVSTKAVHPGHLEVLTDEGWHPLQSWAGLPVKRPKPKTATAPKPHPPKADIPQNSNQLSFPWGKSEMLARLHKALRLAGLQKKEAGPQWRSRPILKEEHAQELDHAATAAAIKSGSAKEGERSAYEQYERSHRLDAAAHHFHRMAKAVGCGNRDLAERHRLAYAGHAQALGYEPLQKPPPEIGERIRQLEQGREPGYRSHAADVFSQPLERSERLSKDLASLRSGPKLDDETHDYSHLLKPEHRQAGYSLSVQRLPHFDEGPGHKRFDAVLHHNGKEVGSASACTGCGVQGAMSIDTTTVSREHRGKGLGSAMYEAAMAHGHNELGAKHLRGGIHSTSASRTHMALSRKHGLGYKPDRVAHNAEGEQDSNFGPYSYALKSERKR